jgi:hypothetical protein
MTSSCNVCQLQRYCPATAATDRSSLRTAAAIIALARGVTRARAGMPGTDSVNTVRSHIVLVHSHFRFRHCSTGRSGPT